VAALQDINLKIEERSMVCLRGPSGSGKTTILSIIGCLFPPTSGSATIMGKKISRLPDHFLCRYRQHLIGCIFQNFNLLPELTVLENVTLPLYPMGLSPRERKRQAEPLLNRFGIAHRQDFPVARISGGELQRVAICRALINNPPILLADEPTAHLDSRLAEQFMTMLVALKAEGKTIVLTSHDPRIYHHPGVDRVLDVADGRLVGADGKG
jgi:putative ABC transport system ATP-binding protein